MFSYHPNTRDTRIDGLYARGFETCNSDDPAVIARAIVKCVTSPIVWSYGRRLSKFFRRAQWVVIDVDDGKTISETLEIVKDLTHVIGTTKSHRKLKHGKVCDRFRVWLKLDQGCEDLRDFSATVKHWARLLEGDVQAIDGARKFLPCKEIVSVNEGSCVKIKQAPNLVKRVYDIQKNRYIPRFVEKMLNQGVPSGERNYSCMVIGQYLSANGYNVDEIVSMIMGSPVPAGSWCHREVTQAVRNGARRAGR